MIILGIDPGLARFGYGFLRREGSALTFVNAGVITTPATLPVTRRLAQLMREFEQLCSTAPPNRIVMERLFSPPGKNLSMVAEVRGIILLFAGKHDLPVEEVSPRALKSFIVRSGAAPKMQIRKTIQRLLALPALPSADAADALGLAILGSGNPSTGLSQRS